MKRPEKPAAFISYFKREAADTYERLAPLFYIWFIVCPITVAKLQALQSFS
jgi:hypothetical protein